MGAKGQIFAVRNAARRTSRRFAAAVAPKHSGEDLDKARTHTCANQFTANNVSNPNGGMRWVDKDGGYYAECVTRLKS
jgi:hypothetical protein